MQKKAFNKILIVGDACRGKSTLASKLSSKLGIPHHSTDDFLYKIKFTKYRDQQEAICLMQKVFEADSWIVEGTTKKLYEFGLGSSDIIIHLRYKNIPMQWLHLIKRSVGRESETFAGLYKLMKHVLFKKYKFGYRKGKPTPAEIIDPYKHKTVTFSSFKEIDSFVDSL